MNYLETINYALKSSELGDQKHSAVLNDAFTLVKDFKAGHSSYQLLMFVLNEKDNPTPDSKYQQALREIDARVEALKSNYYHIRKVENEAKQLESQRNHFKLEAMATKHTAAMREMADLKAEEIEIELEKRFMQLDTVRKDVARLMREMDVFVAFCKSYRSKLEINPADYVDSLLQEHKHFLMKLGLPELSLQSLCHTTTKPEEVEDRLTDRVAEADEIMLNRGAGALPDHAEDPKQIELKEDTVTTEVVSGDATEDPAGSDKVVHLFKQ